MHDEKTSSLNVSPPAAEDLTLQAYQSIRRMLFLNELSPDQKLHYRALAQQFGMSPTPVIQALKWLEFQGLVRHERNRGFYLKPSSVEEVEEVYMLREVLERSLVSRSILHLDENGTRRLRSALDAHLAVSRKKFLKQRLLTDMEFHLCLASLSGSTIAVKMLKDLFDILYLKYKADVLFASPMDDVGREHEDIFTHVCAGNSDGAEEVLARHLRNVRAHVVEGMQRVLNEKQTLQFR